MQEHITLGFEVDASIAAASSCLEACTNSRAVPSRSTGDRTAYLVAGRLPGFEVSVRDLQMHGFRPFELKVVRWHVTLPYGCGTEWDTLGRIPDMPGVYAFSVEDTVSDPHVVYVGQTAHLWMVTKGVHPRGGARGGNRYGRPLHAGSTRQYVNAHLSEQLRLGRTVRHWLKVIVSGESESRQAKLDKCEADLIYKWRLQEYGWNRSAGPFQSTPVIV